MAQNSLITNIHLTNSEDIPDLINLVSGTTKKIEIKEIYQTEEDKNLYSVNYIEIDEQNIKTRKRLNIEIYRSKYDIF